MQVDFILKVRRTMTGKLILVLGSLVIIGGGGYWMWSDYKGQHPEIAAAVPESVPQELAPEEGVSWCEASGMGDSTELVPAVDFQKPAYVAGFVWKSNPSYVLDLRVSPESPVNTVPGEITINVRPPTLGTVEIYPIHAFSYQEVRTILDAKKKQWGDERALGRFAPEAPTGDIWGLASAEAIKPAPLGTADYGSKEIPRPVGKFRASLKVDPAKIEQGCPQTGNLYLLVVVDLQTGEYKQAYVLRPAH